jgi:hypothetical protein
VLVTSIKEDTGVSGLLSVLDLFDLERFLFLYLRLHFLLFLLLGKTQLLPSLHRPVQQIYHLQVSNYLYHPLFVLLSSSATASDRSLAY